MANAHAHTTQAPLRAVFVRSSRRGEVAVEVTRFLGAVSVLIVGAVHAQQYYDAYFSVVPTIGTLFLLSFIGSAVVGAVLLAPVWLLGRKISDLVLVPAALGAIGIALGSLVSLLISEYRPLFGFMESGYRSAIVLALASDVATAVFLGAFVLIVAHDRLTRPAVTSERNAS